MRLAARVVVVLLAIPGVPLGIVLTAFSPRWGDKAFGAGILAVLFVLGKLAFAASDAEPAEAAAPTAAPPAGEPDMPTVLARLGIPLDSGVSTPEDALRVGMSKASIHRAWTAGSRGNVAEAVETLEATIRRLDGATGEGARVLAVALFMRGRLHQGQGQPEEARAAFQRALALDPGNDLIVAAASEGAATPPRAPYVPPTDGAAEVRRHALEGGYEAVLRRHPPREEQAPGVQYLYTLAVYPAGGGPPAFVVSSEYNKMPPERRSGSHFLGVFPGEGHLNLGASDDWADEARFEARALEVARERLATRA